MTYRGQAHGGPASFWEIFWHSWRVLWERPGPFLTALLALSLLSKAFSLAGNGLMGPFSEAVGLSMGGQFDLEALGEEVRRLAAIHGYRPLVAGLAVPWLLGPFTNLALASLALNLWDGYQAGTRDLGFAARRYPAALLVTVITSLMGVAVVVMVVLVCSPMALLHSMGRGQGHSLPVYLALSSAGLLVGLLLFIRVVWPFLRRYVFLQFLTFFGMVEGQEGPLLGRLALTFSGLKAFPRHLNQAVFIMLAQFLVFTLALSIVQVILSLARLPGVAGDLVVQFLSFIAISWFIVALAGFFRLCLAPARQGPDHDGEPLP
ncbi:MAG: hypothetical protein LBL95_08165 [Deltaproteobacteria bacterium]|jgi:hypothetical protein|nr:hypothetical protein [Deltaproteobacteria bacterium]